MTGLVAEAAHLERIPCSTFCSGGCPGRAAEGARQMVDSGATGLVSFGVGGGLDPSLPPGFLVAATMVITPEGEKIGTDTAWRNHIVEITPGPLTIAEIAGSDHAITSPQAKSELFAATGAVAVDMESHAVARVALEAGLLLGQGGEFAFVLLSLASQLNVMPDNLNQVLIIVVVLSMALTPALAELGAAARAARVRRFAPAGVGGLGSKL